MGNGREAIELFFEDLVYQAIRGRGFTQHSPVMVEVWGAYGREPGATHDLLLTPRWESTPGELAARVRTCLALGPGSDPVARLRAKLACNQSVVVARLSLQQLVAVLALSRWWREYLVVASDEADAAVVARSGSPHPEAFFAAWRADPSGPLASAVVDALVDGHWRKAPGGGGLRPTAHLLWLVRVVGTLAWLAERIAGRAASRVEAQDLEGLDDAALAGPHGRVRREELAAAFMALLPGGDPPASTPLWAVDRNRPVDASIFKSTATIKADAARHLFEIKGKGITWAVVDTGIDATHLAFRKRDDHGRVLRSAFEHDRSHACKSGSACTEPAHWRNNTRIKATYDFRHLRELLGLDLDMVERLRGSKRDPALAAERRTWARLSACFPWLRDEAQRERHVPQHPVEDARELDWTRWGPLLEVPHTTPAYRVPTHHHGTHVAGILAADWRHDDAKDDALERSPESPSTSDRVGVAPELELYDLRVLGADAAHDEPTDHHDGDEHPAMLAGDEFSVLSALELVRTLNRGYVHMEIHGVNLSLSIPHALASFACGRTPVCNACDKLDAEGVVVVAAAGNNGRVIYQGAAHGGAGGLDEGYRSSSITDPGNAQSVITVGATHRTQPHAYGVSYFSSRGPTGDGRRKPDLVAPGEKIVSTRPGNLETSGDGTSMAAPHVSGAAALLMCRHEELRGRPQEIKRILCATATDLGREPYFQGAGLVDILRALQAV